MRKKQAKPGPDYMKSRNRITTNDAKNEICSPSAGESFHKYAPEIPLSLDREVTNICRTFEGGKALSDLMRRQRLPLNYASLTGELYALNKQIGAQFDSPLAQDYLTTLEFNNAVISFSAKPVTIEYEFRGKRLSFAPDVLVHFGPADGEREPRPWLVDVRSRRDLQVNADHHEVRSAAATCECARRSWEFRVLSEAEIRTPYLSNAKFFIPFRKYEPLEPEYGLLRRLSARGGCMTAAELIQKVATRISDDPQLCTGGPEHADVRRARLLSMVWKLIAIGCLAADFHHSKVDENTTIWNPFFGDPRRQ